MNPTPNTAVEALTIGLDLGDRRHAVCVLSAAGDIVAAESIPNTREVLTAFAARFPAATFIMETGTHCSPSATLRRVDFPPLGHAGSRLVFSPTLAADPQSGRL